MVKTAIKNGCNVNNVDKEMKMMYTTKKPKRARGKKGRYLADDKSTPGINEAWVGGKAPKKGKK